MKTVKLQSVRATITTLRAVATIADPRAIINTVSCRDGNLYQYVNGKYQGLPMTAKALLTSMLKENESIGLFVEFDCYGGKYHHQDGKLIRQF